MLKGQDKKDISYQQDPNLPKIAKVWFLICDKWVISWMPWTSESDVDWSENCAYIDIWGLIFVPKCVHVWCMNIGWLLHHGENFQMATITS